MNLKKYININVWWFRTLGLLKVTGDNLVADGFDGAFNPDGTIVKPKQGRNNTILLFPDDPNYTLLSNTARDMALGTNKEDIVMVL